MHLSSRDVHESQEAPTKTGRVATDKEQPGKPNVHARWVAKEILTRKTSISRFDASAQGAESGAVIGRHGYTWRKVVALVEVRRAYFHAPLNCRQKITRQVMNSCAGSCNTA